MKTGEFKTFLSGVFSSIKITGALLPTSGNCSKAFCSTISSYEGKKNILEAGPGTGSVTSEILKYLKPGDKLTLVEINPDFSSYLRKRFEIEPLFIEHKDQVTILNEDITKIKFEEKFNFIISTLPFSNFESKLVEGILNVYESVISDGGFISYIEYAYLRRLKTRFSFGKVGDNMRKIAILLDDFHRKYLIDTETVFLNVPPAWIYTLKVGETSKDDINKFRPKQDSKRLGPVNYYSLVILFLCFIFLLAGSLLIGIKILFLALPLLSFILYFFRDPIRNFQGKDSLILSAADGVVMDIDEVTEPDFEGINKWIRVKVFLSLFNVHINYSPFWGILVKREFVQGENNIASSEKSEKNNSLFSFFEGPYGPFVVVQRTGIIARRIVNWYGLQTPLARGDRFGLIRFGSRTDVYFPADKVRLLIEKGTKVKAGVSPLAEYVEKKNLE